MFVNTDNESEDIDDSDFEDENEDANDSEENDGESEDDQDSENEDHSDDDSDSEEDSEDSDDDSDDDADDDSEDEGSTSYRPSPGDKKEAAKAMVPLKKYLKVKSDLKQALKGSDTSDIDESTLDEFAEEAGLKPAVVKRLANIIIGKAKSDATKAAREIIKPMINEKISKQNQEAFEADFEKSIAKKYPELVAFKENFKKLAFSSEFLHLKTLEDIRKEFYPNAKSADKKVKTGKVEGGSKGGDKNAEKIDFATLTDNPEQYAKVMKDPKLREKYYEFQDSSSD